MAITYTQESFWSENTDCVRKTYSVHRPNKKLMQNRKK